MHKIPMTSRNKSRDAVHKTSPSWAPGETQVMNVTNDEGVEEVSSQATDTIAASAAGASIKESPQAKLGIDETLHGNDDFMDEHNDGDGQGNEAMAHKEHTTSTPLSTKTAAGGIFSTGAKEEKDIATSMGSSTQKEAMLIPSPTVGIDLIRGSAGVGLQPVKSKADDVRLAALKTEAPYRGDESGDGAQFSGASGIDGDRINLVVLSGIEAFNLPDTNNIMYGGTQVCTDWRCVE